MYHCIFNYNDILVFFIFQIEISSIVFLRNFESMISLYFLSQYFYAFKEFHKIHFLILIDKTTLHLLFVGRQVIKDTC